MIKGEIKLELLFYMFYNGNEQVKRMILRVNIFH